MWIPEWILGPIRAKVRRESEELERLREVSLRGDLEASRRRVRELENELKRYKVYDVIELGVGDPLPTDVEKRRLYAGAVAGLHKDILRPKFRAMIASLLNMLEDHDNPRDYDLSIKGAVYGLREIIRWGDSMVSEDAAYTAGDHPSSPEKE